MTEPSQEVRDLSQHLADQIFSSSQRVVSLAGNLGDALTILAQGAAAGMMCYIEAALEAGATEQELRQILHLSALSSITKVKELRDARAKDLSTGN